MSQPRQNWRFAVGLLGVFWNRRRGFPLSNPGNPGLRAVRAAVRMRPQMRRSRWILLLTLLVFAIVTSWLWWVRPRRVDMASYAPADSVLYLEANQPLEVVETMTGRDAWQAVEGITGPLAIGPRSHLLQGFIRWTGIGPIQSVILARAQIAAVVTDLGTIEEGDTLRINQQEAILIETHTSEGRIKAPFEQAIKTLAEKNYGNPTPRRITLDGVN